MEIWNSIENAIIYFTEIISQAWKEIIKFVKKVWTKTLNFLEHVKNFFLNLKNQEKLKDTHKALAIKIDELLKDDKNYNTVNIGLNTNQVLNTVYDTVTGTIDYENSQLIDAETLDDETKEHFGDKPIIILT